MKVEDEEDKEDHKFIQKVNALLRSHYGVNPQKLSNRKWAKLYNEYLYIKGIETQNLYKIIEAANKQALAEILSKVLNNG